MTDTQLEKFEKIIGYEFRNKRLLERALTHSSYCNEIKRLKNQSNERLEFLGDAVLEVTVSDYLFEKYPDKTEGELTKLRAVWMAVCQWIDRAPKKWGLAWVKGLLFFLRRGMQSSSESFCVE